MQRSEGQPHGRVLYILPGVVTLPGEVTLHLPLPMRHHGIFSSMNCAAMDSMFLCRVASCPPSLFQDLLSLLAYPDPHTSPFAHLLSAEHVSKVADRVNEAILCTAATAAGAACASETAPTAAAAAAAAGAEEAPGSQQGAAAAAKAEADGECAPWITVGLLPKCVRCPPL